MGPVWAMLNLSTYSQWSPHEWLWIKLAIMLLHFLWPKHFLKHGDDWNLKASCAYDFVRSLSSFELVGKVMAHWTENIFCMLKIWGSLDYYIFYNFLIYFLIVQLQMSPYPLFSLALSIPHLSLSIFSFIVFVHGSFTHVPWLDPSSFPHYALPPSPLVTVSLFFISMSPVLFFSLVCFIY